MRAIIKRRGKSAYVRIPLAALRAAGFDCDSEVEIRIEPGAIAFERVGRREYRLSELIKQIKPKSLHGEVW